MGGGNDISVVFECISSCLSGLKQPAASGWSNTNNAEFRAQNTQNNFDAIRFSWSFGT